MTTGIREPAAPARPVTTGEPHGTSKVDVATSPRTARIVLSADKPEFFVGENVLVHFCIKNTGAQPIAISMGGDYRGAVRALRYRVSVRAPDGTLAADPDSSTNNFGGLVNEPKIAPGESYCDSVPLLRYAEIDKGGLYTIRISHDLGWENSGGKAPEGVFQLRFVVPTTAQAERVVADALAIHPDDGRLPGEKSAPYRDLAVLRQPYYLAPLEARLGAKSPFASEIIGAIGAIETPEATETLLRLASAHLDLDAGEVLKWRLPDPEVTGSLGPRSYMSSPSSPEREALIRSSWRPEHLAPARALGLRLLASKRQEHVLLGAYYLRCIGTPADLAPLAAVFGALVDSRGKAPTTAAVPGGSSPELVHAVDVFLLRGAPPVTNPRTTGERIVWLRALTVLPSFHPADWEARLDRALTDPTPFLRELAVGFMPEDPPMVIQKRLRAMLADPDAGVAYAACTPAGNTRDPTLVAPLVDLLARTTDPWVLNAAAHRANKLGGGLEVLRTYARRLDDPAVAVDALSALIFGVMVVSGFSANQLTAADILPTKARWVRFIEENAAALASGQRFEPGDPQLPVDMFPKIRLTRRDGSEWP